MRRIILSIGVFMIFCGISCAGLHFGLGKAAAKKSAEVIEEAVQKSTAAASFGGEGSAESYNAPTNVAWVASSSTTVTVSWSIVSANGYTMMLASDQNFSSAFSWTGDLNQANTTYAGLTPFTNYWFKVKISTHPDSAYSSAISTKTDSDCPGGAIFSSSVMDLSKISGIRPLGALNPSGHTFPTDHNYYAIKDFSATPTPIALSAPCASHLTSLIQINFSTPAVFTEYHLEFLACSQFMFFFQPCRAFHFNNQPTLL
ncbi:MAG: fibronectin type III domain-containing protein [Elusimicrobia bacterium]|nr:fibronectin type III domain-containing protein [Elusimicrobiota bacterium]